MNMKFLVKEIKPIAKLSYVAILLMFLCSTQMLFSLVFFKTVVSTEKHVMPNTHKNSLNRTYNADLYIYIYIYIYMILKKLA